LTHECPVTLLAICPRQHVADWYDEPIPLGHPGFVLNPIVLGPERIPVITDSTEAGRLPTLGVLSAAAHGPDVIRALHTGLDFMMTDTYEYTSAWTESLKAEGRAEGKAEAILRILDARGKIPSDDARKRIEECRDLDLLDVWFNRALNITRADQLFED
jgi:hypothetical protein